MEFLYFLRETVYIIIMVIDLAMLVRVFLSWIPIDEDGKITNFVYFLTEPVILPVRMICNRFDFLRTCPLDVSFFITGILLTFLMMVL
ncbi:MAG: YggT family protein [Clostridia bacterium]|nr:YggT family protein [Clostridia bacterium]